MYLGGRETMAVFRNYSSLYASPLTPLDSVFRLILTEIYLFFALFTRHMYVRWIIHQIQSISELLVVKWLSTTVTYTAGGGIRPDDARPCLLSYLTL